MYTSASGHVKPNQNIVLRKNENRLEFEWMLPLTPRPDSGYNSPTLNFHLFEGQGGVSV
jgi:hypothetical protein